MATEVLLSVAQMAKLLDLKTSNADLWVGKFPVSGFPAGTLLGLIRLR
jgi:hypothetical protein